MKYYVKKHIELLVKNTIGEGYHYLKDILIIEIEKFG